MCLNTCTKRALNWESWLKHSYLPYRFRARLIYVFKYMFSVLKQFYTYFHTLFHSHVFPKNTNNVTRIILPNGPCLNTENYYLKLLTKQLYLFGNVVYNSFRYLNITTRISTIHFHLHVFSQHLNNITKNLLPNSNNYEQTYMKQSVA